MAKKYLAHTKDENGNKITCAECKKCLPGDENCHLLKDHLEKTAELAREKASVFGARDIGYVLGLCHDFGKYSEDFQDKLRGKTKQANHAMSGAVIFSNKYQKDKLSRQFALAIASHHTGLMNLGDEYNIDTYLGKLQTSKTPDLPFEKEISLPETLSHNLRKILNPNFSKNELGFQVATYIRMLFSVLVDSDFTDTEEFCSGTKRIVEHDKVQDLYEKLVTKLPQSDGSELNNTRAKILKNCLDKAENEQGLFTLTVPTGGGKTKSSLAFALKHALKHDLRRVIYVVPYTTIIEQNAKVIKEIVGENNVLEHHSNIQNEDLDDFKYRWATENWDVPIVITTNVQFFESLFSNKTRQLRKIHNIAKSVIIFDEAQMLPIEYLSPCMFIVSELILNYGCSAVLCSATQPTLQKYVYKDLQAIEIAENVEQLFDDLKRVDYINMGKQSDDEIVKDIYDGNKSALVVVNSRRHAYQLYEFARKKSVENNVFYLSTLLIPLHRSQKINEIKKRLLDKKPTIVISTQLIEAGVDIDFPVVYRSLAGIDSIIQAGGRANREGKREKGLVKVFEPTSDIGKLPTMLEYFIAFCRQTIYICKEKTFDLDGIKKYFEIYYSTVEQDNLLDKYNILNEFQVNNGGFTDCNFKNASDNFKLIEDHTKSIIIECKDSKEIIEKLRSGYYQKTDLRKLQQFTLNIYPNDLQKLINDHAVENIAGIYVLSTEKYYNDENGLDIFTDENKNAESHYV
ncbi:MAG: CRISPR-associated helicase Cas3' [Candidatus Cloacimonetes bacterium]|nr:CRISPR-associated helicase Cas3' [Candidatus Cloacimonadota bacterium]